MEILVSEERDLFMPNEGGQADFMADFTSRYVALAGGWYAGKALSLLTPIPTPGGWTTMGAVRVGDQVFDEAGRICHVGAVFDVNADQAWRVHFADGTFLDACGDHQWATWTNRERVAYARSCGKQKNDLPSEWPRWRSVGGVGPRVRLTREIAGSMSCNNRDEPNHSIPVCGPLQTALAVLPIDPYVFGLWLGDGHSNDALLTIGNEDLLNIQAQVGGADYGFGQPQLVQENSASYRIGGRPSRRDPSTGRMTANGSISSLLRSMAVLNDKHVPSVYLRANANQRLALLQGLMDSDGTASNNRSDVEFCNTNRRLASQVLELARSLGQKPTFHEGVATLYGRPVGPKYRVTWSPTCQPFRLPRKAIRIRTGGRKFMRNFHRMIVRLEAIPSQSMRCIQVNGRNSMYLAGEGMIPTHNTWAGARKLASLHVWNAFEDDPDDHECQRPTFVKGLVVGQDYSLATTINVPELRAAFDEMNLGYRFVADPKKFWFEFPDLGTRDRPSMMLVRSADAPEKINGFTVGHLWGDEVARWACNDDDPKRDPLTQTLGRMRDPKAKIQQAMFTFTHEGNGTRVYRDFEETPKPDHKLYRAGTFENPDARAFGSEMLKQLAGDLASQYIGGEAVNLSGSSVYANFTDANVNDGVKIRDDLPLDISIDFNISPGMHALLGQCDGKMAWDVWEIHAPRMSVKRMVAEFRRIVEKEYGGWKWQTLRCFGDASGESAWAGSGESCWDLLKEELNTIGVPYRVMHRDANPHVADRVNAVNAALCNARGDIRYKFHSRCERLRKDFRTMKWDKGELDKRDRKISHASDAAGYRIEYLMPIRKLERRPGAVILGGQQQGMR